jgi:hypothetical protein
LSSWAKRTYAGFWRSMPLIIMSWGLIGLLAKTLRSIAPSSTWAVLYLRLSSADFITFIAESDFRHRQVAGESFRFSGAKRVLIPLQGIDLNFDFGAAIRVTSDAQPSGPDLSVCTIQ